MNLLTDIIRDVATDMNVRLTHDQEMGIQKSAVTRIVADISWIKHEQIMEAGMPWLEKEKKS